MTSAQELEKLAKAAKALLAYEPTPDIAVSRAHEAGIAASDSQRLRLLQSDFERHANPAAILSLLSDLRAAQEALKEARAVVEPFAAMGSVLEARSRITFGKVIKDDEVVSESIGEAGFGILTMGHFRDALHVVQKPRAWSGFYRSPVPARLAASDGEGVS